jgi:hypothetical protein
MKVPDQREAPTKCPDDEEGYKTYVVDLGRFGIYRAACSILYSKEDVRYPPLDYFRFWFRHSPSPDKKSETKLEANCIYTGQQCYNSHYEHEAKPDAEACIST